MGIPEGEVLPQPGVPKTLGILNVIFGVLLMLFGTCLFGLLISLPAILTVGEEAIKKQQVQNQAQQKATEKTFDDREKAAKTDEEKDAIRKEKAAAIASAPKAPPAPDLGLVKEMMGNPTLKTYLLTLFGSGLILSVVLMISGIGLIRLAPWGRSLALTWAALQILQLLLVSAYGVAIQPAMKAENQRMLKKVEADPKLQKAIPGLEAGLRAEEAQGGLAYAKMVFWILLGSTYPTIVLILLNTAGARAACLARDDIGREGS